jgi:serine/threonine-protein kinase RsbW
MASAYPPFTLTVPSNLRMVSLTRAFLEAVCQVGDMDQSTTHAIVLATGEAVSNIIRHAHHDRPEAQLQVQCYLHPDAVEILLYDEGAPFDLVGVPHLDPGELRLGGRGVFLMRALMDELSCQHQEGRGNVLRMVKRRPGPSELRDCG